MEDMASFAAYSLFPHDIGNGFIDSFAALTGKQDILGFVEISMAGAAVCDGFDVFDDFMLHIQMTQRAFDFVFRDVLDVHEVSIVVLIQSFGLKMAFETIFSEHFSVSDDDMTVAFFAL